MENNPTLDKIRALLAKAESTDSAHEAEALTDRANKLMVKYAVDQAMLDATADKPDHIVSDHVVIVDAPYAKIRSTLLFVVADALGVKTVRIFTGNRSKIPMHLIGYSKDIELVEMLYTSLLLQSATAMAQADRERKPDIWGRMENGKTFRTSFMYGFVYRVHDRLKEIYRETVEHTPGTGLVLVDRKAKVANEVKVQYPKLTQIPVGRVTSRKGYEGGQEAGDNADLGQKRFTSRKALR